MATPKDRPVFELPPIAGSDGSVTVEQFVDETNSMLSELREEHATLEKEVRPLLTERRDQRKAFEARIASDDESKRPSNEERDEFAAAEERFNEQVTANLQRMEELAGRIKQEERVSRALSVAHSASIPSAGLEFNKIDSQREPQIYRRDNQGEVSYFLDLAAHQNQEFRGMPVRKLEGYQERLERHSKQMAELMPNRWAVRKREAEARIESAEFETRKRLGLRQEHLNDSPFTRGAELESYKRQYEQLEQRAPSRIVGQGGYAIPPLWLIDEYIPALRPGRVAAGLCRQMPLPDGTDSINIPRLLTPTLTAVQSADAGPVVSRDFSDTFQQANVKTIAGQEDVPIQLIEQSPGQILDRVLMTDLIADYNKQVDLQVLQGSGVGAALSGGQVVGIYPATNWGATTVATGATFGSTAAMIVPPQAEFFQFLGALASKTAYSRFNLTDFNYVMHPRRHFWSVTGVDTTGRPLGSDDGFGPYNAQEIEVGSAPYEGYAGRTPFGANVYIDANVPITDNGSGAAGGSSDIVIGAIWDDLWLFEGDLRTRVLAEVLSGTLELRFQVYAYIAFLARYGVSIAIGYGSAMTAPQTTNGIAF